MADGRATDGHQPEGNGMTELHKHPYRRGDISGWCGDCQLPRTNAVHDLPAVEPPDRYEVEHDEATS